MDIYMKLILDMHYIIIVELTDNGSRVHHCMSRTDILVADGVNQGCLFDIRQDVMDAGDTGVFVNIRD